MDKMISYAQNAEDVLLARVFADVPCGFYVDVGAWHPIDESVTKTFYERGWSGINIEPQVAKCQLFGVHRPRDINLNVAVSDYTGHIKLWVPAYSALATCREDLLSDTIPDYADPIEHIIVTRRLEDVLHEFANSRNIEFLKIDVEGYESTVLAASGLVYYRPVVLLIEATSPHTNEPTWHEWEPSVLSNGYLFALFDGLNRWYVREESSELLPKLSVPVNCLDGYITHRELSLENQVNELLKRVNT